MKQELQPLLLELCHFIAVRNEINARRHRAMWRKNYYLNAIKVVEAHNKSNYESRQLTKYQMVLPETAVRLEQIYRNMGWLRDRYPRPKKWQAMGLHKLRSIALQAQGEYATTKHETMEFSIKSRTRIKTLVKALGCRLNYTNGAINTIRTARPGFTNTFINLKEINTHAKQYELNTAMETMLK